MANELNIVTQATGLTVTADIYTPGFTLVTGAISCPEIGGATGRYSGSVPAATLTNELYHVVFVAGGQNIGRGLLMWDAFGDKEVELEQMQSDVWKDRGLDPDQVKTITENTEGEDYDEAVAAEIQKSVVKAGSVTTIDRA